MHRYYFHDHLDETVTMDSKGAPYFEMTRPRFVTRSSAPTPFSGGRSGARQASIPQPKYRTASARSTWSGERSLPTAGDSARERNRGKERDYPEGDQATSSEFIAAASR